MQRKRNRSLTLLLILFQVICTSLSARNTVIYGTNALLAGRVLKLTTFKHKIFNDPVVLDSAVVDSSGYFEFQISIEQVHTLEVNLGKYSMQFFTVPGDSCQIDLPAFSRLTRSNLYDPYFEPDKYLLVPQGGSSKPLNTRIYMFETLYDSLYQASMKAVVLQHNDTIAAEAYERNFKVSNEPDFEQRYRWFTSQSLFSMAFPFATDSLITRYFSNAEPDYYNPAFWDAFNASFNSPIMADGKDVLMPELVGPVWKSDYLRVREGVSAAYHLKHQNMTDLLVIKGIYEAWHVLPDLHPMLEKLLKDATLNLPFEPNRNIAERVLEKLTHLLPGKPAAEFRLRSESGVTFTNKTGQYLILGFVSPELLQCQKDIHLTDQYLEFINGVNVLYAVLYQPEADYREFVKRYGGNIQFTYLSKDNSLIEKYAVNRMPTYYLISPDGTLLLTADDGGPEQMFKKLKTLLY